MFTPEEAKVLLTFLDRTQISGKEVQNLAYLQGKLKEMAMPPQEKKQEEKKKSKKNGK